MAEEIQTDSPHFDQDSNPLSSEFSPDFDDVSVDSAITSKHHERLHKLRTWWSKKRPTACITFPNLSDSSDSDDDFGDDVDDVIFALARCRAMRVVGKLTNIQQNVEMIYRTRYGPPDLHDATCVINLSDRQRSSSVDDIRWGQIMLLNSVDILQSKISMVRRLFLVYKMNMSKYKSNQQDHVNHEDNNYEHLVSTQSIRDEVVLESDFASKRHKIVHNLITSRYHHHVIDKLCSLLLYLIKPSLFSEREAKIERKVMLEDAFRRIRVLGLQDCLNDQSWNVLDSCHLPNSSIVLKCINLSTFFTVISQDDPRRVRTATPLCDVAHTPSAMISQYQDIIVYFRNTALFCAYIYRRLRNVEQELCVAMKHFSEMRDKRLKNCKPVSDGDELLRRVMMKREAVLEMNEIANTSASPEECRAKRFMIKGILRIEKRAESLVYRFTGWRRSREFPSLRRTNNYYRHHDCMRTTKPQPRESRVFYQMTLGGIIIKRFCIARDSLVRKAFSRSTIGLNDALLITSNPH